MSTHETNTVVGKERVDISLDRKLRKRFDRHCARHGMTRSGRIAVLVERDLAFSEVDATVVAQNLAEESLREIGVVGTPPETALYQAGFVDGFLKAALPASLNPVSKRRGGGV